MVKRKAKRRGPPRTTGPGTLVGLRCHVPFLKAVDDWRARQDDKPTRPAAIMRLAEAGLGWTQAQGRTSAKSAARASNMAGMEIDRRADQSASVEERASRKQRLLKGPKEFRDMREDHQRTRKPRA
jgi:hypothetical protein